MTRLQHFENTIPLQCLNLGQLDPILSLTYDIDICMLVSLSLQVYINICIECTILLCRYISHTVPEERLYFRNPDQRKDPSCLDIKPF